MKAKKEDVDKALIEVAKLDKEIKEMLKAVQRWDYEPGKEIGEKLNELEVLIEKVYGKRCKTKANMCLVCRVWIAFDNLKVNLE